MAITVRLETERGDELATVGGDGTIEDLAARAADESFTCWRFVDPYGDTVFNAAQAVVVLEELDRLVAAGGSETPGLRSLAERCRDEVHLYLRFVGD